MAEDVIPAIGALLRTLDGAERSLVELKLLRDSKPDQTPLGKAGDPDPRETASTQRMGTVEGD